MDRDRLTRLVAQGTTLRQLASELRCSPTTVRYWIDRYELPSPISVRRQSYERARAEGRSSYEDRCSRHGVTEFAIVGSDRRGRCKKCRSEAVSKRRRKVKEILVQEAGGACQLCGYDECIAALGFHHKDPASKRFGIGMRGVTRSLAAAREEAAKCVLLCANCHAAVEAGALELPLELRALPGPS